MSDLLFNLLSDGQRPFAVISRRGGAEIYAGDVMNVENLADIPLPESSSGRPSVLAAVPFRQISERGFACHDDNAPLVCLMISDHELLTLPEVLTRLPATAPTIIRAGFTTTDTDYAATVTKIIDAEISCGAGANFVIRRDYAGAYAGSLVDNAMALLRRLLLQECGAYWTFAFVTPDMALVGATPERHVSAQGGQVLMNPISGTYRHHPERQDRIEDFLRFLADAKETEELFMVVDEELKMMAAVCDAGGQVLGPYLTQMGHLTHTEYLLRGRSRRDVREILRRTMFAPTVTGSPVHNATRVIRRYEPSGRGYYSGVLALMGRDDHGQTLDAPIVIRTCEFNGAGQFKVSVGATLVRDSDPDSEVAETHAKLAGVRHALGTAAAPPAPRPAIAFASDPQIAAALAARNTMLAPFWTQRQPRRPVTAVGRVMIIDAEDDWAAMLSHQLRSLGMVTEIRPWNDFPELPDCDVVLAGPGPGDPTSSADPRINALGSLIRRRMLTQMPLVTVCLSHQILAAQLGYPIVKLDRAHQGTQVQVDLFGVPQRVGFYNSFAALTGPGRTPEGVEVSADPHSGVVHALRGRGFASVQFHAESILTTNGIDVLDSLLAHALGSAAQRGRMP